MFTKLEAFSISLGIFPPPPSSNELHTYLIQLLRVVTSHQEQYIRADILGHGIVMASHLTVINQELCVGHEFGYP